MSSVRTAAAATRSTAAERVVERCAARPPPGGQAAPHPPQLTLDGRGLGRGHRQQQQQAQGLDGGGEAGSHGGGDEWWWVGVRARGEALLVCRRGGEGKGAREEWREGAWRAGFMGSAAWPTCSCPQLLPPARAPCAPACALCCRVQHDRALIGPWRASGSRGDEALECRVRCKREGRGRARWWVQHPLRSCTRVFCR